MEKAKISPLQLFMFIILFELGTTVVVPLGLGAKKDAWIAILLGSLGGLILLFIYVKLYRRYPSLPLTGYLRKVLGKHVGWTVGLAYIGFFMYGAARDLRDVGNLLYNAVYDQTPLLILNALMIISISYVLAKGVEVLARTAQVFMVILLILGLAGNALILFSGIADINRLLPIFENGWKLVVITALYHNFMSPFGEVICFTMLFPYLTRGSVVFRTGYTAMILSGIILAWTISIEVAVLGHDIASRSTFPLLTTISKVDIANFLQRLDAIVVFTLIITVFFKVAVFFYSAIIGTADLFKIQDHRRIVMPIGSIILLSSMVIAGSFSEHIEEGRFAVKSVYLLFSLIIPLVLLMISSLRHRRTP